MTKPKEKAVASGQEDLALRVAALERKLTASTGSIVPDNDAVWRCMNKDGETLGRLIDRFD